MSYQVLARKWRPTKFSELVGQEHVKSAIINGLTHQRTHHAYLFTGTRGVGKTTIARIFAKSLNCEEGISAEPCGVCSVCLDVDAGRFVDLIEIDAASRTKVGDTREILDNVQYAPTRGRYKIYLIDEVHMLSRHSFNALLKTLEEPPEHVKFLFATTDPQKLPVTILSRCLQFNLQALSVIQIATQLQTILNAEQIPFEQTAIEVLAKFARGSMRDGLSLTDQAIAQSGQNVTLEVVQQMLGTVDQSWSLQILQAVVNKDSDQLVELFQRLQQQQPDFVKVLDDLITLTHQIAMCQLVPAAAQLSEANEAMIKKFAAALSPQQVQVFYQMLLQGKKELTYAVSPASGLEMTCLRLLAFSPAAPEQISSSQEQKKNRELSEQQPKKPIELNLPEPKVEVKSEPSDVSKQTDSVLENEQVEEVVKKLETTEAIEPTAIKPTSNEAESTAPPLDAYADYSFDEEPESNDLASHYLAPTNSTAQNEDWNVQTSQGTANQESVSQESFSQEGTGQEADSQSSASDNISSENTATQSVNHQDLPDEDNPVLAILAARGVNLSSSSASTSASLPDSKVKSSSQGQQTQVANLNVDKQSHESESTSEPGQSDTHELGQEVSQASLQTEPAQIEQFKPEPLKAESAAKFEPEPELLPVESEQVRYAHQVDKWAAMIEQSGLMGLGRQLALNSEVNIQGDRIELVVRQEFAHLLNERSEQELTDVVSRMVPASEFIINKSAVTMTAPADIQQNINMNRQERAEQAIEQDPTVRMLLNEFDAQVIPNSIRPL